jgi:rhamnose transport system permease protein
VKRISKFREIWLVLANLALLALVGMRFPDFIRPANLVQVFNDTSLLIMLALGQMAVIVSRSLDLSMASNLCFSGMAVAMLNAAHPGVPVGVLIAVAIAIGLALGALNGLVIWLFSVPPIVVTLGTLAIYRGATYALSGGAWVNADQMSPTFIGFQRDSILGLPVLSWIAIVVVAIFAMLMRWTPFGRSIYAVGVNPTAALYVGIDVARTKFFVFCMSGAVAGLVGYLWISRYVIASVEVASGYELTIIAACLVGSVSIAGGVGSVAGAVLGALFLGIIADALPVIHVSPFWQMAISGVAIILAVALNLRSERRPGRLILKRVEQT